MKIITTPMCEDVLKIAGLTDYTVVRPDNICNADLAILLSETKSDIPKLSVKLNTYSQVLDSINILCEKFNLTPDSDKIEEIRNLIQDNDDKKYVRGNVRVKVYSNFLKDTIIDMGFTVASKDYDYIVYPDYLEDEFVEEDKLISVPSHKNVSTSIVERLKERYDYLERELCMKQ